MLIFRFEEIKMLEEETFGEFYSKMSDLRNSMVSLGKPVSNVKLIWKILRSLPEHFKISSNLWAVPVTGQKAEDHCSESFQEKGRSFIWRWLWGGRKSCGYVGQKFHKTNERWPIQEEVFWKDEECSQRSWTWVRKERS
jgi:hypothetical protein